MKQSLTIFQVIDLAKAIAPHKDGESIVGFFDTVGLGYRSPSDLAVLKSKLYLTTTSGHLLILDISTPEFPMEISKMEPSATFGAA